MVADRNDTGWLQRHITLHDHDDPKAEKLNAATHAVGVVLSLVWLVIVFLRRTDWINQVTFFGLLIYGCTQLFLYASSSLYHALPHSNAKRLFRVFDHGNIYFLIAGTYTPILISVGTVRAHRILILVWIIALLGIAFILVFWNRLKVLHVILYLAMGWMMVFFWNDLVPFMQNGLAKWILCAGITYSAGVFFYANRKIPYHHAIWHLFCMMAGMLFCLGFFLYL